MTKTRYSEIVDAIDIDEFEKAIGFTPLERRGENDIGHCPDPWGLHKHGDTTGKFGIHREKKVYNCWVCGGGSILSYVMEVYDMDISEATSWLRQFTRGDKRTDDEFISHFMDLIQDTEKRVATLPYFNERVLEKYNDDPSWFYGRGISEEVVKEYNLRFGELVMKPAPIKMRGGEKVRIDDNYTGPAAIFPHYWRGQLVGWQNRWIDYPPASKPDPDWPKWLAKYTNTTDFPKSDTLFNYDKALKSQLPVVVCESVPTVLVLASFDVPAVSFFGGGIKDPQLRLLRRCKEVWLAPDNDSTGDSLLRTATEYLQNYIEVKWIPKVPGDGSDLGDLVNERRRKEDQSLWNAISEYLNHGETPDILSLSVS